MRARFVPNGVGVGLARNRRGPKRPPEPRPSGVHPEEGVVEEKPVRTAEVCVGMEVSSCLRHVHDPWTRVR